MAGNADKYGSKKGSILAIKTVIFLVIILSVGASGTGAYIFVKPKYEEYKTVQEETRKLEEARKAEEEKAAKAKAEKEAAEKAQAEKKAAEEKKKAEEEAKKLAEQKAAEEAKKAEEYVVSDSSSRYLSMEDVEKMSLQQINYAKNEIYARHGRKFQSKELQDFFNSKTWYNGTVEPASFSETVFNEFERANLELLAKVEFSREPGGYKLDQ